MTTEYILQMGYFPDRFAERGMPPDIFWMHVYPRDAEDTPVSMLSDAVEVLLDGVKDKYAQLHKIMPFSAQDLYWSVSPRPDDG